MKAHNDHGFTLVELIVVVAILGVCTSIMALSVGNASSAQARRCAVELDSLLSQARTGAMTRSGETYLRLYRADDGFYCDYVEALDGQSTVKTTKVGGNRLAVSVTSDGVTGELDSLLLAFRRDDGSLLTDPPYAPVSAVTVAGGGTEYSVVIYPGTGSHALGGIGG